VTRCSWCEREATAYFAFADSCPVHHPDAVAIFKHLEHVLPVGPRSVGHRTDVRVAREGLADRDARELRGEPPSLEGWTIFDGSAM